MNNKYVQVFRNLIEHTYNMLIYGRKIVTDVKHVDITKNRCIKSVRYLYKQSPSIIIFKSVNFSGKIVKLVKKEIEFILSINTRIIVKNINQ